MNSAVKSISGKIATVLVLISTMLANCTPGNLVQAPTQTPGSTATLQPTQPNVQAESPTTALAAPGVKIVFRNGVVLTMDPAKPLAQSVAIQGGKILAVGSNEEVETYVGSQTQVIDLQGQVLMPGFVDSHSHVFYSLFQENKDLDETQDWLFSQGITMVSEMTVDSSMLEWLVNTHAAGNLRVRVAVYLEYTNACGEIAGHWYQDHPTAHLMGDHLRVPGIKIFSDGGACNQPAVSFQYQGGGNGNLYFTAPDLSNVIVEAQEQGYQVAIHALGDRGAELALNAIEMALDGQPNTYRHRIEHNTLLRDDLLPRYGEIGVVPLIFGKFPTCFFNGDTSQFKYLTPPGYRNWEWRYGDLIETNPNLTYAWHADYPVFTSINPFEHLYGFVTRKEIGPDGKVCEPADWMADDVIPVDLALQIMTINSAYATFYEDITGNIQPGKFADMILLSQNLLEVDPDELINLSVRMTMVDGKVEYCADGQQAFCPANVDSTGELSQVPTPDIMLLQNLAAGANVTVSNNTADSSEENAVDGDSATIWNSGGDPLQWIEVDLGLPKTVSEIRMQVAQSPSGDTEHKILVKQPDGNLGELHSFIGFTQDGQWLTYTLPQPAEIQTIRIETIKSPSWVAWAEIEIYEK